MGKASRIKNAKLAVAEIKREQQAALEKQNKRKKKVRIITAGVSALLCVVFIASLVILNMVQSSGYLLRRETAIKSDNISINAATFNYFFNYQYQNFINKNSDYLSYYGLDVETSLRDQEYNNEQTWFDYMVAQTEKNLTEILYLSEKAKEDGLKIGDAENKQIDDFFASLKEAAEDSKISTEEYIHTIYGEGVKEQDIRDGLELSLLATKYYSENIDSLKYTDDEINDYFNKNKKDFLFADYKYYTFTAATTEDMTDAEKKAEIEKIEGYADRLMKATSPDSFDSILTDILKEQDMTDKNITTAVSGTAAEGNVYDSDFEVSKWAFDEGAKLNETYLYKNSNSRSVYMLTKQPYRDESETRSVRHILISSESYEKDEDAKAKAEEVLDEYLKGDKTAESFAALAGKYSEDPGSTSTGGLYEDFTKGTMVKEFENWSFDEKRKNGDTEIVKTDYGYHIMYFESKGEPVWKSSVVLSMKDDVYTELYETLEKTYTVELNTEILDKINEIRIKANSTSQS